MVNFFFIGSTGHIGGAVLEQLLQKHPDADIKVLVRDEQKAGRLVKKYPKLKCIIGDTGNVDILEQTSQEADIVINTSPDITHDEGIKAVLRGLKSRTGSKPYYIHTSGASLIWDEPKGSRDARWWDDVSDIQDIKAFKGEAHTHAVTDKIVRDAATDLNVAIISPGFVGGMSPSIEHPTPITTPALFLTARAFKSGWQIAQGENTHAWIHAYDLGKMFMVLVDNAISALSNTAVTPPVDVWGEDAYYFGTSEDISFAKFITHLAPVLKKHGVIESTDIKSVTVPEAARASLTGSNYDADALPPPPDSWAMHIAIMYGINMRIGASRMQKLGWKPEKGSIVDTFPEIVKEYLKLEKPIDN